MADNPESGKTTESTAIPVQEEKVELSEKKKGRFDGDFETVNDAPKHALVDMSTIELVRSRSSRPRGPPSRIR